MKLFRPMRGVGVAVFALLLLWFGGFLRFVESLPAGPEQPQRQTDGIVVLTGGTSRVEKGLELMAAGMGRRMFLSGVGAGAGESIKAGLNQSQAPIFACCVDLDYKARNTAGNAEETAAWAAKHGIQTLRVVTSGYHMPRSLVELRRRLPEVELFAEPVFPSHVRHLEWWAWPGTLYLLAREYSKFAFSLIRARLIG